MMFRSQFAALLVVAYGLAMPNVASAADSCDDMFKGERFTLVVPYKAGGGYDSYARTFAPLFEEQTGAEVIVSNLPAGGGQVGLATVANAAPEDNVIGVISSTRLYGVQDGLVDPSEISAIAGLLSESKGFVARKGETMEVLANKSTVSASLSVETALTDAVMVTDLLGMDSKVVAGYEGSVQLVAALLRGEADFTTLGADPDRKEVAGDDLDFALLLTNKPVRGFDGVPYLAGPGGFVERFMADKPAAEREEAMRRAQLVVDYNERIRFFFATTKLQGERRDCLEAASLAVIGSEEFGTTMEKIGRTVDPFGAEEANAFLKRLGAAYAESEDLLERMRRKVANQ